MTSYNLKVDKPVVILPLADYEALMESLEILAENSTILDEIAKARKEIAEGKGVNLDEFLMELGL